MRGISLASAMYGEGVMNDLNDDELMRAVIAVVC